MMEKRERQRRLNWFMAVVKAKAFSTFMVNNARKRIAERIAAQEREIATKKKTTPVEATRR